MMKFLKKKGLIKDTEVFAFLLPPGKVYCKMRVASTTNEIKPA